MGGTPRHREPRYLRCRASARGLGDPPGGVEIEASFDEFNLDVRIRYIGTPLGLPAQKPTPREIVANEDGERLLAGYLLRRSADRISSHASGDRCEVHLHYDH